MKEIENNAFDLFSLPFDFHIWLDDKRCDQLLQEITIPILNARTGNKLRETYKPKLLLCYKIILLNLLSVHKHKAAECLAIPRNNTAIQPHKRYGLSGLISIDAFNEAYSSLCNDYINVLKKGEQGFAGKDGRLTRVVATPKLAILLDKYFPEIIIFFKRHPQEEVIIKNKNKFKFKFNKTDKLSNYLDTDITNQQRENLHKVNKVLQSNWYDLELKDIEFKELRKLIKKRHEKDDKKHFFIDFSNRRLKRIYSNDSFEKGGRFYGGWWQLIPKDYRKHIRINGKITIEIDFSNMHPFILYARQNKQLESDAYEIDGLSRKIAKKAFNLLLNKESLKQPKEYDPNEWEGYNWQDLKHLILDHHSPIKEYFGSGVGLNLQYKDSQVAERVMLYFANSNYPCLPLHDSFIVHHALKDELEKQMKAAYSDIFQGWGISTECKDYFEMHTNTYAASLTNSNREVSEAIEPALGIKGEYKEYYKRLQLWYITNQSS